MVSLMDGVFGVFLLIVEFGLFIGLEFVIKCFCMFFVLLFGIECIGEWL